jgi:hypothetical protein
MAAAAGAGLFTAGAAPQTPARRRLFTLEQYYLKNGTQQARIHEFLSGAALPGLQRAGAGPAIVMEALVAPHMPQVAVIQSYESADQLWTIRQKTAADGEFARGLQAWESHQEQPYEHFTTALLEAAPYCPELQLDRAPRAAQRVLELRTYHSPTWRQLAALHERFAGPEIRIFHRVGVHPILYTSTIFGPQMPNLTYVIPFDSLSEREKAWNAFGADPEWQRVRKESIDRHGQISSVIQISLYKAAPYSPVR